MSDRAIIFDLVGVLADGRTLRQQFAQGMAAIMTRRYGLSDDDWLEAYQAIVADWQSYHADLNFSGEDGIADLRESRYRITRALFRRTGQPEPSQTEITALAQTLIAEAPASGDALYPAARDLLVRASLAGWQVAVMAHWPQVQIEAVLRGAGVDALAMALGVDTVERYEHDERFFAAVLPVLDCPAAACRVVTHRQTTMQAAQVAGLRVQPVSVGAFNQSTDGMMLE